MHVVDYKTSASAKNKAEIAESLQLAFYVLAAIADPGLPGEVTAAEMWYPAAKTKSVTVRGLDLERMDELVARLGDAAGGIFAEDWTPRTGDHCERCRVRPLCPAWPQGSEAFA